MPQPTPHRLRFVPVLPPGARTASAVAWTGWTCWTVAGLTAAALGGATLALVTAPAPARAHAIESSLDRVAALNDDLLLESRFSNGEPADDAVVRLLPPGGEPIELGRTDASGRIRFTLPSQAGRDWEVQVDRGPGHRDYLELPGSGGPGPAVIQPQAPTTTVSSRPLALRVLPQGGQSHRQPWFLLAGLSLIGGGAAGMLALRRRS